MNPGLLAKVIRERADALATQEPRAEQQSDDAELLRVLARVLEGKSIHRAFGAPGDWGYSHPVGKALAAPEN